MTKMRKRKVNIESGYQIAQKIASKNMVKVNSLDRHIFPFGCPYNGQLIEITGEEDTGKSMLMLEMMSKAILPKNCGGQNVGVLFLDCDCKTVPGKFLDIMSKQIRQNYKASFEIDKDLIDYYQKDALRCLQIVNCFEYQEFDMELINLPENLLEDSENVFIFIDSIATMYWTLSNRTKIDTYMLRIQQRLKKICQDSNAIIIYTEPSSFVSPEDEEMPGGSSPSRGYTLPSESFKADHKIELNKIGNGDDDKDEIEQKFVAKFSNKKGRQAVNEFTIDKFGIKWAI